MRTDTSRIQNFTMINCPLKMAADAGCAPHSERASPKISCRLPFYA
jgi:hypothetical protein